MNFPCTWIAHDMCIAGGPLGVWLSYIIMGSGVYAMMVALGEMSTLFPVPSAITHLASRFGEQSQQDR